MSEPISSPCMRVCVIEADTGLCAGCGRTLGEIAQWARFSENERLKIMAGLAQRLAAAPTAPGKTR